MRGDPMNDPPPKPSWSTASGTASSGDKVCSAPPDIPDYEILKRIGRGAYGEVWIARGITGTFSAVKFVRRSSFDHARPFEREFEGICRFEPVSRRHESQVDILHVGRSDDCFYYVMELADDQVTGGQINPDEYQPRTLKSDLGFRSPLPFEECLSVGIALATALEHLHQDSLVHRDVKPSNIIFVSGVAKLADIGLVTGLDTTRSHVGTDGFAPPEGPGTAQGDLFSLGKVLYEMSTGKDRQDFPELPTNLRELPEREGLMELNAVITRACRHDPRDRYVHAAAMRADLELLQSGKSLARLRRAEVRLRLARRAGAAVTALALVAGGAFWFQAIQTKAARELANENLRLAAESRKQLVRMQVADGNRLVDEGKYSEALLGFTEALKLVQGDASREESHRIRLASIVARCPRVVQVFQHDAAVLWCEFSPDGKRIATGSDDHTARVWEVASGKPITPPLRHERRVSSVVFSPDGKWVLTCSWDTTARIWDASTGAPLSPSLKTGSPLTSAVFSPDGKRVLTAGYRGSARIWDVVTGELLAPKMKRDGGVLFASFSPDGQRVLTADVPGTVTVWDATSRTPAFPPIEVGNPVNLAVFSPDGERILTGTEDKTHPTGPGIARVWSALTGAPLTPPILHKLGVIKGSFSPDSSRVVTATEEYWDGGGVARIWNAETGEQIGLDLPERSTPEGAIFSPDGSRVATCGQAGTARVWDAETGKPMTPPMNHASWTWHATFSPDGDSLATASEDHLVRIWDLATGENAEVIFQDMKRFGHEGEERDGQFSSDGSKVLIMTSGSGDISTGVYDAGTGKQLGSAMQEKGDATLVAFSPDQSKIVTAGGGNWVSMAATKASVWDAATGEKRFAVAHEAQITQATFSPDSKYLLTTSLDRTARVWDSVTGEPAGPVLRHEKETYHGTFSPDGRHVVTASDDQTAQVWDWTTGNKALPAFRHTAVVNSACYSPDGRRIATNSRDQTLRIWDAGTGEPVTQPIWHGGNFHGAGFSPDGRAVASWGLSGCVNVWNAETGARLLPPMVHRASAISWAEFSSTGRFITTASIDQSVRLWDTATGEAISGPLAHAGTPYKATFHPDGSRILSVAEDGVRIWKIDRLSWPLEDVTLLAHLMSGHEMDQTLNKAPLSAERIVSAFHTLQGKYPESFSTRPAQRLAWHRSEAREAKIGGRWAIAGWHLSKLIENAPEEPEWYERRADARAEQRQWELARQDCVKAGELGSENAEITARLLLLCLRTGDAPASRQLAQQLVETTVASKSDATRRQFASVLSCAPDLVADYSKLVDLSRGTPFSILVDYRMARYQETVDSFRALDEDSLPVVPASRFYYAMALHHLGKGPEARTALDAARKEFTKCLERRIPKKLPWYAVAICEFARDEAGALIGKAAPNVDDAGAE